MIGQSNTNGFMNTSAYIVQIHMDYVYMYSQCYSTNAIPLIQRLLSAPLRRVGKSAKTVWGSNEKLEIRLKRSNIWMTEGHLAIISWLRSTTSPVLIRLHISGQPETTFLSTPKQSFGQLLNGLLNSRISDNTVLSVLMVPKQQTNHHIWSLTKYSFDKAPLNLHS